MVGKDDPGTDAEGCVGTHPGNRLAQDVDLRQQQIRPAVEQIYGKESSPRNPIAAIIRHTGSMFELWVWQNTLRFSALLLLIFQRRGSESSLRPCRVAKIKKKQTNGIALKNARF